MKDIITKSALITKADYETGEIQAYVTTFENKDVVNDVIKQGALDDFITKFENSETDIVRLLLNHDRNLILGQWVKFEVDEYGVLGTAKLSDVQSAKDVKTLIADGILGSVSIGFKSSDFEKNEDGGMDFNKIELIETSIVDRPANSQARITSVKSEDGSINKKLLEQTLRDAGCSSREAKTIVSVVSKTLPNVRDECDRDEELLKLLSDFKL